MVMLAWNYNATIGGPISQACICSLGLHLSQHSTHRSHPQSHTLTPPPTPRVVYDQLSRDPNSLANLDQDLPNYVQHSIPIFSLPREWLWCESWCGEATKGKVRGQGR